MYPASSLAIQPGNVSFVVSEPSELRTMADILYVPHTDDSDNVQPIDDKIALLLEALETIVREYPPQDQYVPPLKGLWSGPTGIAYLFLHASVEHPVLKIAERPASHWAVAYLGTTQRAPALLLESGARCGISSETLVHLAVQASVTKDMTYVKEFIHSISMVSEGEFDVEWHSGRAGTLYLIRMICHWVPDSTPLFQETIAQLRHSIMSEGPDWKFHDRRYLGAAHGDIGTLTQVALSSPMESEREKLQDWLIRLLDWQKRDGNWPVNEQTDPRPYVQFCHGAPGFVQSLISIRHMFPEMIEKIDQAICKANELVWQEGLLIKEPNLCHGAFGNLLTLAQERREHFLSRVTSMAVANARQSHTSLFKKANYGQEFSLLTGYWPGAAWIWLVSSKPRASIIGYNDV